MSVLSKICGITRKDGKRNVEILKELSVKKYIVDFCCVSSNTDVFWSCEPYEQTTDFQSYYYMVTHTDIGLEEDQQEMTGQYS